MQTFAIDAVARNAADVKPTELRKQGLVPSVMYGHGVETQSIAVPAAAFRKVFAQAGSSSLIDVKVDAGTPVKALIKDVQVDPLTMTPIHIDFHQVNMKETMHANVPLVFVGESVAVKALGGTLAKSLDHIEVECLPADLPHEIQIDISTLATFDDIITVGSIVLPKGVTTEHDTHAVIATVVAPMTEEELKKLEEESHVGDVTAVKSEADIKKEADAAAEANAATETK
ncbi:MAG: 50S ribosomal protein L25 [Patescibacteria group bacterium]